MEGKKHAIWRAQPTIEAVQRVSQSNHKEHHANISSRSSQSAFSSSVRSVMSYFEVLSKPVGTSKVDDVPSSEVIDAATGQVVFIYDTVRKNTPKKHSISLHSIVPLTLSTKRHTDFTSSMSCGSPHGHFVCPESTENQAVAQSSLLLGFDELVGCEFDFERYLNRFDALGPKR